ncbi:T9SS type A sorting domain-containing protein [Chryseobacterium elymi]|nr:T9SS type A sorting domain-containing protein [Chryseobacterium elymi]
MAVHNLYGQFYLTLKNINHQLEKGIYMVQISNGKDTKTSKLIIK